MKYFVFISLALIGSLFSNIENHYKKIVDKPRDCKIKNIDYIYLINLDERDEKYQLSVDQLNKYGIKAYRFSAVDGWKLSIEAINEVGTKYKRGMVGGYMATSYHPNQNFQPSHEIIKNFGQTYYCHCTARGTIGCALSHLSVLKDAYDSGYNTIWVMEDDIEIKQNPLILSKLIEELDKRTDKNWDILYTDRDIRDKNGIYIPCSSAATCLGFNPNCPNPYALKIDKGPNLRQVGARFSTTSMIIRRRGMEKILGFYKQHGMFLPIDMTLSLPKGIRLYTVRQDVVTNIAGAISDNGVPRHLSKSKKNTD